MDSDDWVHEDFLNIMSTFLFINENLDAVACDYVLTDENEKSIKILNCEKKPIGCGIMFRAQQLINLGLYDETFKYAEEEALRKNFLRNTKLQEYHSICIDTGNIKIIDQKIKDW